MKRKRMLLFALACTFLAGTVAAPASAGYPERPIRMIVPAPPGGGTDIAARMLAEVVEPILRQKVVVENRAGGGGTLGVAAIVSAPADGYTLATVWNSPLTATPNTLHVPYSTADYTSVLAISWASYVFCVQPDFPAETAAELVALLRAEPQKYTYATDGVGGTLQLAAERIFRALGVKVRAVPFGGAGESLRNFLGRQVTIYGGSVPPVLPHARAGRAKCLLLTSAARNPQLPQAWGLADLGIASAETVLWRAVLGPKGLDPAVVAVLRRALGEAIASDRYKEFLAGQGEEPAPIAPGDLERYIADEMEALAGVARDIGLQRF